MNLKSVITDFANRLSALVESQSLERARAATFASLGGGPARRGRPPKLAAVQDVAITAKGPRKKAPRQLCPVPGCKNPAAPIFGMVCAKHKDVPKAKIKKFREARRAKKLGLSAPKPKAKAKPKAATKKRAAARKTKAPKVTKAPANVEATPTPAPASPSPAAN